MIWILLDIVIVNIEKSENKMLLKFDIKKN